MDATTASFTSPFDTVIEALRSHNFRPRVRGNGARALCPAHKDRRPSLGVTDAGDRVLMNCFAGCRNIQILAAIGLKLNDLFAHAGTAPFVRQKSTVESVYSYEALNGEVCFEKVRYQPKRFRMRVPDPQSRGGHRWNLKGVESMLYRWPDLIECRRIVAGEGEKAVNLLWSHGIPATCGPYGAGRWIPDFTAALWCAGCVEVVMLPDHDGPGERFAKAVATACGGYRPDTEVFSDNESLTAADLADPLYAPLTVKIVRLPDLRSHEDVVDWFGRGGTPEGLVALIDSTPVWSPEAEEHARLERARAQNAQRQRRWRANHR